MKSLTDSTVSAREALVSGEKEKLGDLMKANFALRKSMYGEEVIGKKNLEMTRIATTYGCLPKFTGSVGAAIIGI